MITMAIARRAAALTVGAVTLVLAPAGTASAAAGHTYTETQNFHGTQTDTVLNPCTGDVVDTTNTGNSVFHVTTFTDSDEVWFTFTEEDSVAAVDKATGVTYSGHGTVWGNQNVNNRNSNSTFTQSTHITGSDGSSITYRDVMHVTVLPSGQLSVSFDKPSLICR